MPRGRGAAAPAPWNRRMPPALGRGGVDHDLRPMRMYDRRLPAPPRTRGRPRDALDHLDRPRPRTRRRKDRGSPGPAVGSGPDPPGRCHRPNRRPGRPGVTVLIHQTGPGPGGRTPPARWSARRPGDRHAGDEARSDWSDAGRLPMKSDRPTTARFGVRDRTVWGTGSHGLGYGIARFGVRDRTVWGTGPHGLGYGIARFGVRDRTVWGTDFGWSIDLSHLHLLNLRRAWSVLTLNSANERQKQHQQDEWWWCFFGVRP